MGTDGRRGQTKALLLSVLRLSVCPSVAYIANNNITIYKAHNNSRTQIPSVLKFGRTILYL